jgi:hypothetical protein
VDEEISVKIRPSIHKKLLFVFALYLLFSVVAVAFDHHGPAPEKQCLICAMAWSLSSAVAQSGFIPEVQFTVHPACVTAEARSFHTFVMSSCMSYRGPPPEPILL